jgi:MFS transporter, ACS family, hexuronate transporter
VKEPLQSNARWVICGLLFFATTVNYIDRQALGILKPTLAKDLHWSESDYGWIVSAFQFAYALTMPLAGRMVDLLGTRLGYALAVLVWSTAAMSHSLARTWGQFVAARFGLGMGEAANFPAAIKTVAEWFPEKERALATGIFNSGSNVGAVAAPLLIPVAAYRMGWRGAFLFTGGLDLI